MCGRFLLKAPSAAAAAFHFPDDADDLPPRYNVAPSQPVLAVRAGPQGGTELVSLRWGLVPSWSKDSRGFINARAETAPQKPAFRTPFRQRRCLVLADGFYEWVRKDQGGKQPFYFHLQGGRPFAFAGLWDRWGDLESCALLTTTANELVRPVHERMPVILAPGDGERWLDPRQVPGELLRPFPASEMDAYPVSSWVNNARHEGPRCIEPEPAFL
jgi:putative SOS response-associated peptidase YedK